MCVLSGCGSPSTTSYSLINSEGRALGRMVGGDDCDFCDLNKAPDMYRMSGACRVTNNTKSCSKAFPFSFNLALVVLKDISNTTTDDLAESEYREFTSISNIPHGTAASLKRSRSGPLIVSC
ncbi:hypothetical protein BDZ45DRAFT_743346 [Acephala macrosclerotiorum]|nr:hypothetical protein BDZ45DRAFT_743346 [Acephala macrosclerotiorum]